MEYPSLDKPKAGATRFNTDSSQLEIYDGNQWTGVLATSPELQTGGCRGVLAGGYTPSDWVNTIDFINMSSSGDATNFGDLTEKRGDFSGTISSRTRGCFAGGWSPNVVNVIDYVTIATLGNAQDFGDMTQAKYNLSGSMSSKTRMVLGGGSQNPDPSVNVIEYWEFATTGNGTDFGDLSAAKSGAGQCSNAHGGL